MKSSRELSVHLTRTQTIAGWIYFPFYLIGLSLFAALIALLLGYNLLDAAFEIQLNLICGAINLVAIVIIFHNFLIRNLSALSGHFGRFFLTVLLGLLMHWGGTTLIGLLTELLRPELSNINNDTIASMADMNYRSMFLYTVLLAPIVEETLFRGLIFSSIYRRRRIAAYAVSMLAFAAVHVAGYVGVQDVFSLALNLIEYLPAGFALCWAYVHADSIWAPILIHCIINTVSMLFMQLL